MTRDRALVVAAWLFVVASFQGVVAGNNGFEDWGDLDYYKLLVRGWQKGQLNIDKDPSPELLALADPYDPAQNGPYKMGDISLYQGKYYLYFGPTPAFTLMWPWRLVTGREMTSGAATWVFCTVALTAASVLWLALRRRYFPGSHALMAPWGVLALGFGTHLLALAQRPMMWELPISAGIAFTSLAALACLAAWHGWRPVPALAAAGLCLGLAVGARPTCLLATGMLLMPLGRAWLRGEKGREWWRLGFAAGLPLAVCGLAIMWHNHARFGSPLEWGQNYQLSGAYEGKLVHFSPRFFLHNLTVYLFQPLLWRPEFPFAYAQAIEIAHIPDYFGTEEVCGKAVTFPFYWFLLGLPLAWVARPAAERHALTGAVGVVAAYAVPVGGLVLCYFSTTMRYQTDYAVALAVLALLGLLALERFLQQWARTGAVLLVGLAGAAVAVTVGVGTLVMFDYHGRSMRGLATEQWRQLADGTHDLLAGVGLRLGEVDGPRVLKVRFRGQVAGTVEPFWEPADPVAGERVFLEHLAEREFRFGVARDGQAIRWGRRLTWKEGHTHTVSLQLPSLYRPEGHGRWAAFRRDLEHRERTGISVWFSGGRALQDVRTPLRGSYVAGGRLAPGFSGELRDESTRLLRRDEFRQGFADAPPGARPGGTLRLRVHFPAEILPGGEPLVAAGAHFQYNFLFAEPAEGGVKLAFDTFGEPRVVSPVLQPSAAGHWLDVDLPAFRPEAYGQGGVGDVVVRLDGREVLRSRQRVWHFPEGWEALGENPYGVVCRDAFRGWVLQARWVR
ncbi:MAG: hypothetical protein ACO3JJ_01330 [Opitutaceae bacterium]